MHFELIAGFAITGLVCAGLGYGFRGIIHKDLAATPSVAKSDVKSYAMRIENAALGLVADSKTELLKIVAELRKL